jgi:hypothetical protein
MPVNSYCTKHNSSKCNGSCVIFMKQNINFNIPPNSTFIFLVFHNNGLVKIFPSLDDLPSHNIFFSYRDRCKFFLHLKSLNARYYWMVEISGLKIMASRSPSMTCLLTKFHKNLLLVPFSFKTLAINYKTIRHQDPQDHKRIILSQGHFKSHAFHLLC